jgi:iron complex outermembrane receptor protein
LILTGGARWDSEATSADMPPTDAPMVDHVNHHVNAFEASAVKILDDTSKVFARYATVYRFPFIDEQVSFIGFGADQFFADLKPEKGQNYEVGTEVKPIRNLRASLTLFLLDMQDEIAWNNITMRNDNLDNTRHDGAEANVDYTIERICEMNAAYTYTDTSFTKGEFDGNDVPLVPRHKVTGGVGFFLPFDVTAGPTVEYVGSSYLGGDNANVGPKLGDYAVVGLNARCTPRKLSGFEVRAGVDNLLDRTYADLGYKGVDTDAYYPANGRAYTIGASYKF